MTKHKNAIALLSATAIMLTGSLVVAEDENPDFTKFFGGLTLTDGNSDTMNASLGAGTRKTNGDNAFLADLLFSYGESTITTTAADGSVSDDDVTTTENLAANAQFNRTFSDPVYGFVKGSFLYDDINLIDYRVTVGPGLGTVFGPFSLEAGVVFITEDVGDVSDDYIALRFAEKSEHVLSEGATFYQSVEFIPSVDDFSDDYLINAKVGVDAAINATLSLTVFALEKYDNTPAAGQDESDLTINAGVTYNL